MIGSYSELSFIYHKTIIFPNLYILISFFLKAITLFCRNIYFLLAGCLFRTVLHPRLNAVDIRV